jgi:hypothetical protein
MSSGDLLSSLSFWASRGLVGCYGVQDPVESWVHQGFMKLCGHYRPYGALWILNGPSLAIGPLVSPLEDRPAHGFPQGPPSNGRVCPLVNSQPGIL